MPMRVSGMVSGMDTESIVKELVSAYSKKSEKYTKAQTKLEWKQEAWKNLNSKIYNLYTGISNMRYSSAYTLKKVSISDQTKATVSVSNDAINGTQKLNILETAQTAYLTGAQIKAAEEGKKIEEDSTMKDLGYTGDATKIKFSTKDADGNSQEVEIEIKEDTKLSDVLKTMRNNGVNANYDKNTGRIFVSAKTSGKDHDFTISAVDDDENSVAALEKLGLKIDPADPKSAKKIEGRNAKIRLNEVEYENSTNDFTINGLTISALTKTGESDDNAIVITVATDAQGVYDKVKDFLTQYNEVMKAMTAAYNADSSKDYEPLTDEEKSAMSDKDIEKWEKKIKDSLLRRDTTLNSVMSAMKNAMSQAVEVNGKRYSLSSFGIHTMGFLNSADNEESLFHIDGDEEDSLVSGNKEKLMAAITEDPETVTEVLKSLVNNLYDSIDQKMKSTSISSVFKVYNDKELDKQHRSNAKLISDWADKVSAKEDYYYKKFSKMEAAMAKFQSQQSSMGGLFSSN